MDDRTQKISSPYHAEVLATAPVNIDAETTDPSPRREDSVFPFAQTSINANLDTSIITQEQKEHNNVTDYDANNTAITQASQQNKVDDSGSDMELTQEIHVVREFHEELTDGHDTRTSSSYQNNVHLHARFEQRENDVTDDRLPSFRVDKLVEDHTDDFSFLRGLTSSTRPNDDDNESDMLLTQEIPQIPHANTRDDAQNTQNTVPNEQMHDTDNMAQSRKENNEVTYWTLDATAQQTEKQQDNQDDDDRGSDMILTQGQSAEVRPPTNEQGQAADANTVAQPPDEVGNSMVLTEPSGFSSAMKENTIPDEMQSEETPTQNRYTGKRWRSSFDLDENDTTGMYSFDRTPTARRRRLENIHRPISLGSPLASRGQFREPGTIDHSHRLSLSPDRLLGSTTAGRDSPLTGRFHMSLLNDSELLSPIAKRGIASPQRLFSPRRSFYLHGGSPLQRPRPFPRTFERPESQGSPVKPMERSSPHNDDRSVTSENLDRLISMQGEEQKNILDEEYPQLYNSFSEDMEASPPENRMALHEFFRYVGIVLKELEPVGDMVHTSGYYLGQTPAKASEQAVAAATIIPELETYKAYTEDLNDLVREDEKSIRRIEGQVIAHNPSLFGEYIFADAATRNRMETMFNAFKDHAGVKANQTLYEWMSTVLRSTVDGMKKHMTDVEKDLQELSLAERNIQSKLAPVEAHARYLEERLPEAQERERKLPRTREQRANADVLEEIRREEEMLGTMSKFEETVNQEEAEAKQKVLALERRSAELEAELAELEQLRLSRGHATEKDLEEAKDRFYADQRIAGWRLEHLNDSIIKVILNNDIHVAIDKQKLVSKEPNAIEFSFGSRRPRFYEEFHDFILHGLREYTADVWVLSEVMTRAAVYVGSAVIFVYQIRKVGRLYFTEICKEGNDKIKCTFVATNLAPKAKVTISIEVTAGDIRFFPAINMENVTIHCDYGAGSQEDIEAQGRALLERRGFACLSDTIKEIVTLLAAP
ncbi:Spc7 kinetochore protein-domain-containing protein [Dichotomocladium elegans]|nr:Spc7 kinetochore protein-domain-containing protein [Dichotomocladium elegans]